MSKVGDRIKLRREALNITQEELARRMGYKSKSSINKVELGVTDIPLKKVSMIARLLETTEAYLMGWVDDPKPPYTLPPQIQRTAYDIYKEAPVIYDVYESDDRDDLVKHADYLKRRQDYLLPNAAHAEDPTPEQIKNADNIMNNPDEWS